MIDYNNMSISHPNADALNDAQWTHPDSYGGHSPDGAVILAVVTRDSDAMERSNWIAIRRDLEKLTTVNTDYQEDQPNAPYDFRAGHWACGWVEYLIIPSTASLKVLEFAGDVLCALSDYPVYDESHYSDLEWNEVAEYWERASISDRIELCADNNISVFAARRDTMPEDDNGALYQQIAAY